MDADGQDGAISGGDGAYITLGQELGIVFELRLCAYWGVGGGAGGAGFVLQMVGYFICKTICFAVFCEGWQAQ